ncbi:MAG TPA: glycerol-3-phosphate dehydrogenase/oxidase [Acidimicrobiia bacterium]|nr:glycerol-3-phosphate dehydrogenase/oxidase [Acidimicrobiia bacterium]
MAWTRASHLIALGAGDEYDTLVVGGGIIGAGVALDLAARGLRVALVEQHDFASGTSGRSTKLFHGGIRYLPQLEFHLVAEGLREQAVLASIADYLFEPLEFVIPLYRQYGIADAPAWAAKGRRAVVALKAGLMLYDLLGGRHRPGASHRHLMPEDVLRLVPRLRSDGLRSGYVYSDAQTDDARLVLAVVKAAIDRYGATAVSRLKADRVRPAGAGYLVDLTDTAGNQPLTVKTRTVVAATGAFPAPSLDGAPPLGIVASKGAHLIVDRQSLGLLDRAIVLPETEDERVLFIIPWQDHALIGTTDTPYREGLQNPAASSEDIDYLIRHVTKFLDVDPFEPLSTFAGLRALAEDGGAVTAQASRDHVVAQPHPGYTQVAGGKLTTYRRISAEVAGKVARHLDMRGPSPTAGIPLAGAGGEPQLTRKHLVEAGIGSEIATAAVGRYGTGADQLLEFVSGRADLLTGLGDGRTIQAEVIHAVRNEGAVSISDFTLRRTRLAFLTPDHSRKDQGTIASLMASELGWDDAEIADQIVTHEMELAAEGL